MEGRTKFYILKVFLFDIRASFSIDPEEKPLSDQVTLGLGTISHSAPVLEPTDLSYRHYWSQIQTQLSPQKSPAVSYDIH